ncbi:hypothetical protein Pint_22283 [Pistacia integerrima]|uniref:Uncharacterized protein n=1 Tax=Pistacia integerrima TaxID=434235 RepID=A0ACC0YKA7_9ROSI|nr:hypothetical protein Pint_22283 [Pistacia integerrima]
MRFPPRKTRVFFEAEKSSSFSAPPASSSSGSQTVDTEEESYHSNNINNSQGQGQVYEDDKRVIRTGPNPLHN